MDPILGMDNKATTRDQNMQYKQYTNSTVRHPSHVNKKINIVKFSDMSSAAAVFLHLQRSLHTAK